MEHHQRLLHLSPHQEHLMIGHGLFDVGSMHFHGDDGFAVAGGAVVDDSAWMEDLMHLGIELFGDDGELSGTRKRRDRSKTIVSERKRRFRTKEKLHELRALVPNITNLDKASIIADAVEYIKNLQSHARKLKEEVATLEARPGWPGPQQQQQQHGRGDKDNDDEGNSGSSRGGGGARVTLVSAAQVGKGRFFVTVECERWDGVAAPLSAAVESMADFVVESSNIGCSSDRVVSTLTLKVSEEARADVMTSERAMKLWVMAALLSEGFRPEATSEIC